LFNKDSLFERKVIENHFDTFWTLVICKNLSSEMTDGAKKLFGNGNRPASMFL